jgi:hypothetical protein
MQHELHSSVKLLSDMESSSRSQVEHMSVSEKPKLTLRTENKKCVKSSVMSVCI